MCIVLELIVQFLGCSTMQRNTDGCPMKGLSLSDKILIFI